VTDAIIVWMGTNRSPKYPEIVFLGSSIFMVAHKKMRMKS
jgi:hypothetical protein